MSMTYREWAVSFDYGYWNATGPDYDASWEGEEDGYVDNGQKAQARTLEDLHAEIDEIEDAAATDEQAYRIDAARDRITENEINQSQGAERG